MTETDTALKLSLNRGLLEGSEQYAAPFGYGPSTGFWETNPGIDTGTLFGSVEQAGIYGTMRWHHDIVSTAYDARKAAVSGLTYKIVPRSEDPSLRQRLAAEAVSLLIASVPDKTLPDLIAEVYDHVNTYGHILYELYLPEEGSMANRLHMTAIPAQQISWWNYDPTNRDRIQSVEMTSGDTIYMIDGVKLAWFGNKVIPGNFWGVSELRRILAIFMAYVEDLKNYISVRRLEKGILYFQEGDEGSTEDSWIIAKNFLMQYFNGRSSPLIIPRGMTIENLNVDAPQIASFGSMWEYFDSKIRAAVDSSLSNLGISGVGSLALGKEVSVSDREKFVAHVDNFIKMMNNPDSPGTDLLKKLTEIAGFDPEADVPCIEVVDNTSVRVIDSIDSIVTMLDKGLLELDDIPMEARRQLLIEVGISTDAIDKKIAATSETSEEIPTIVEEGKQPIAVGSLQIAAEMIQKLRPADPTVTPLAPEVAVELIVGAGFDEAAARRMVTAQLGAANPEPLTSDESALAAEESKSSLGQLLGVSTGAEDPIDMNPTQGMIDAAKEALAIRESLPPSRRAGTAVGLARARDIVNDKRLSLETWTRIYSFLSRHGDNYREQKEKLSPSDFKESKVYQAVGLWGGIDALTAAKTVMEAHEES